ARGARELTAASAGEHCTAPRERLRGGGGRMTAAPGGETTMTMLDKLAIGLAATLVLCGTAGAAGPRRCAPITIRPGGPINCVVQNYRTTTDSDVPIVVLGGNQGPATFEENVGPGQVAAFAVPITNFGSFCGCEVTGASSSSRVSLSVQGPGIADSAAVTVSC